MLTPARAATSRAAQPGDAPAPVVGQPDLLGGDLGSPRGEELADLGSVVHATDGTAGAGAGGMPCQYTSQQGLPGYGETGLAGATELPLIEESTCEALSCMNPRTSESSSSTSPGSTRRRTPFCASSAACVCGSDLWPYRGVEDAHDRRMGHEYVGVVEEVGDDVRNVQPGQFVVGSFFASDNTCEICRAGYQTHCVHRQPAAPTVPRPSACGSPSPTARWSPPPPPPPTT